MLEFARHQERKNARLASTLLFHELVVIYKLENEYACIKNANGGRNIDLVLSMEQDDGEELNSAEQDPFPCFKLGEDPALIAEWLHKNELDEALKYDQAENVDVHLLNVTADFGCN